MNAIVTIPRGYFPFHPHGAGTDASAEIVRFGSDYPSTVANLQGIPKAVNVAVDGFAGMNATQIAALTIDEAVQAGQFAAAPVTGGLGVFATSGKAAMPCARRSLAMLVPVDETVSPAARGKSDIIPPLPAYEEDGFRNIRSIRELTACWIPWLTGRLCVHKPWNLRMVAGAAARAR